MLVKSIFFLSSRERQSFCVILPLIFFLFRANARLCCLEVNHDHCKTTTTTEEPEFQKEEVKAVQKTEASVTKVKL